MCPGLGSWTWGPCPGSWGLSCKGNIQEQEGRKWGGPVLCRIGVGRVDTLALFLVLQEKLSVPHMMPAVGLSIPRRRVCRQPRARPQFPLSHLCRGEGLCCA